MNRRGRISFVGSLNLFCILMLQNTNAYVPQHISPRWSRISTTRAPFPTTLIVLSETKKDDEKESLSFDAAKAALLAEEDKERSERMGQRNEKLVKDFEAKSSEYDSMRESIRSRAASLDIEKSVATQRAIEEATRRAAAREEADSYQLDLSKVGVGKIGEDPEDLLTDEERERIDPAASLNPLQQALGEIQASRFPGPLATIRQVAFMAAIFVFTATYILNLDQFVRNLWTDVGMLPRPDQVFDYSDLSLPEGWDFDLDTSTY